VSCFPDVNQPVTGAPRVAFVALIVLLLVAFELHRRLRPPPSRLLRAYVGTSSVLAFLGMLCAIDLGATDRQLWTGIVAPVALAVFSLYAELWRPRPEPLPAARARETKTLAVERRLRRVG
jgi:hypothetical protein